MSLSPWDVPQRATNSNRTYLGKDMPMNVPSESMIADFSNSQLGWLQVIWEGNDAFNGTFELWASALPDRQWFCYLRGSRYSMNADLQSLSWINGAVAFRYAFVRYIPGNVTTGTMSFIALGKGGL